MNIPVIKRNEQGAALVVSLVLLLGLTAVGIASMKETVTQQQVVNAIAEDDTAFQAAEFALREGERFVEQYSLQGGKISSAEKITFNGETVTVADERANSGSDDLSDSWWKVKTATEWVDRGSEVASYPLASSSQKRPSFLIEILAENATGGSVDLSDDGNTVMNYRITARGYGVNSAYFVILQSTVGVQL